MLDVIAQITRESLHFFLTVWYWIALGFVAAGFLREFVPQAPLVKMLGGSDVRSLCKASILGVIADFLPHSSLQLAVSLFDLGASRASVITFMISTPWLCIIESLILISFTGTELFLVIVVLTMIIAVLGGVMIAHLERRRIIESDRPHPATPCLNPDPSHASQTLNARIVAALHHAYAFLKLSGAWLAVGFLGAGVTKVLIPPDAITHLLGYSVYSIPLALLLAFVMETALEASIPIICSLYTLGASPGVIFTLLMAGIVTDITELGTIATVLGKRTAMATVLIFSSLTLVFGYLINVVV
jgi:uncharacterized membrane protein YraQ (UPF0718 family)